MGDYQPLRLDTDCDATVRNRVKYPKEKDKKSIYYKKPMSLLRGIAFSASIVLCILTICLFLWIVPCDWDTCPVEQSTSWDRIYYGLELKGPLNTVHGPHGLNLVGMFQGALWGHDSKDSFPSYEGGIISLVGRSGVIAWWTQLVNIPLHLDCSSIDADRNGIYDCLVQGKEGYLGLIDALSGVVVWSIQNKGHASSKNGTIEDISLPIILPDINGDGVNEILALGRFNLQEHHIIILISGKTGQVLGNPLENKACSDIGNLMVERKDLTFLYTYTCKRESKSDSYNIESLTLQELVLKITNISIGNINVKSVIQPYIKDLNSEWIVGKHHLSPMNRGLCPGNCSVMVNITDDKERPFFSYFAERTFVMKPEIIHFNPSVFGFLLKFWQWHPANHQVINKTNLMYIHSIMELVVLFTFNGSKTAEVNASQADIVQLCTDKVCQPELESQTDSLLLVDLDEDGFQELISYMVTYKSSNEDCLFNCTSDNKWKLQTKVRVIRLQEELPKLYENNGHKR